MELCGVLLQGLHSIGGAAGCSWGGGKKGGAQGVDCGCDGGVAGVGRVDSQAHAAARRLMCANLHADWHPTRLPEVELAAYGGALTQQDVGIGRQGARGLNAYFPDPNHKP